VAKCLRRWQGRLPKGDLKSVLWMLYQLLFCVLSLFLPPSIYLLFCSTDSLDCAVPGSSVTVLRMAGTTTIAEIIIAREYLIAGFSGFISVSKQIIVSVEFPKPIVHAPSHQESVP
jgi:hypothetical protein